MVAGDPRLWTPEDLASRSAQPFHPIGHQPLHDQDRSRSLLYKQHATTAGVQAMDLINNSNSTLFEAEPNSHETVIIDANGRKRRKVSTLTTGPLPTEAGKGRGSISAAGVQETTGNDWSHLLRWQQDGDNEIVAWDDEEEDIDDEEGAVDVIEDEETDNVQTARTGVGKIPEEEVVNVINERIDFFSSQWQPGKGWDQTKLPADPIRLWEEAEAAGQRQQLINLHKFNVDFFQQRLNRWGDGILKSSWNTIEEVRSICKTLEVTVESLEEAEWLLSIYKLGPANENTEHDIDLGSGSKSSASQQGDPDEILPNAEEAEERTPNRGGCIYAPESTAAVSVESDAICSKQHPCSQYTQSPGVVRHGPQPELASIHAVSQWDMSELVASWDRKRIIMKVVHEMSADKRELIRSRIKSVRKKDLLMEIPACVNMLWRKETKMQGVLQKDTHKIVIFTRLFLCWWLADNYFDSKDPTEWHLGELAGSLRAGCQDPEIFYDWVLCIFANTFSEEALTMPCAPSQAEIIVISDDEDGPTSHTLQPTREPDSASLERSQGGQMC